jgi:DNA-binding SARP family transcriptional activator
MPAMLRFSVLGPLEVRDGGDLVRLGGPKQRATLALLLLSANRVLSIDRLADALYDGRPPVTAVTQVQRQISELRKALGTGAAIETSSAGYAIRIDAGQLDLRDFERLSAEGTEALARGEPTRAVERLREALALWRGPALADLAGDPAVESQIARLEELQLEATEHRIGAELALGGHTALVGEIEQLVAEHPLRESLRAQLMLALYRSGRQVDALELFRATRAELVERFGIEPGPELQKLQQAILRHEPMLDPERHPASPPRAALAVSTSEDGLHRILAIAAPLAQLPGRELILNRLVASEDDLAATAAATNDRRRRTVPGEARVAVFTSVDPSADVLGLTSAYDVDVVLTDAPAGLADERLPRPLAAIFEQSPADVGVLTGTPGPNGAVVVPFGGGEHDWAALELAGLLAVADGSPLRLAGARADVRQGERDASRLLAHAALAVQRVAGIDVEPVLTDASGSGLLEAVAGSRLVVAGVPEAWRRKGIGDARRVLLDGPVPVLLVHRGLRPGGLAPRAPGTRFTWTVDSRPGYSQAVSSAPT